MSYICDLSLHWKHITIPEYETQAYLKHTTILEYETPVNFAFERTKPKQVSSFIDLRLSFQEFICYSNKCL